MSTCLFLPACSAASSCSGSSEPLSEQHQLKQQHLAGQLCLQPDPAASASDSAHLRSAPAHLPTICNQNRRFRLDCADLHPVLVHLPTRTATLLQAIDWLMSVCYRLCSASFSAAACICVSVMPARHVACSCWRSTSAASILTCRLAIAD